MNFRNPDDVRAGVFVRQDFIAYLGGNTAIFAAQCVYWQERCQREDGWWYNTQSHLESQIGLKVDAQKNARKRLRELGVLKEKRLGCPPVTHYRLNIEKLSQLVASPCFREVNNQLVALPLIESGHYPDSISGIMGGMNRGISPILYKELRFHTKIPIKDFISKIPEKGEEKLVEQLTSHSAVPEYEVELKPNNGFNSKKPRHSKIIKGATQMSLLERLKTKAVPSKTTDLRSKTRQPTISVTRESRFKSEEEIVDSSCVGQSTLGKTRIEGVTITTRTRDEKAKPKHSPTSLPTVLTSGELGQGKKVQAEVGVRSEVVDGNAGVLDSILRIIGTKLKFIKENHDPECWRTLTQQEVAKAHMDAIDEVGDNQKNLAYVFSDLLSRRVGEKELESFINARKEAEVFYPWEVAAACGEYPAVWTRESKGYVEGERLVQWREFEEGVGVEQSVECESPYSRFLGGTDEPVSSVELTEALQDATIATLVEEIK